jgi:hypothetical protein
LFSSAVIPWSSSLASEVWPGGIAIAAHVRAAHAREGRVEPSGRIAAEQGARGDLVRGPTRARGDELPPPEGERHGVWLTTRCSRRPLEAVWLSKDRRLGRS